MLRTLTCASALAAAIAGCGGPTSAKNLSKTWYGYYEFSEDALMRRYPGQEPGAYKQIREFAENYLVVLMIREDGTFYETSYARIAEGTWKTSGNQIEFSPQRVNGWPPEYEQERLGTTDSFRTYKMTIDPNGEKMIYQDEEDAEVTASFTPYRKSV